MIIAGMKENSGFGNVLMFPKELTSEQQLNLDRQFVFIEAPIDLVGPEALLWGEAAWWPKNSSMQFRKTSPGDLALGTTFDMVYRPLNLTWKAEVLKFEPGTLVERTFRQGFFKGYELVRAEERSNGTRVEYELHYAFFNLFNMILWNFFGHRVHDANIKKCLSALKVHCLKQAEKEGNLGV